MNSARILIVDDEKNIRNTIAQALESLGHFVHVAFDGKDAMMQLEADEYDLILTDLKMPGIDGLELLRRAVDEYPSVQIAVISAHGTVENAVEAMKLGAIDFLQKPFTPRELRDFVYNILERGTGNQEQSDYQTTLGMAKDDASKRQFDSAIARAKAAIGLDPSQPEAFTLLGELQEVLGDRPEAVKNYRVAVNLDPTYKRAQDNLSRATRSPKSRPTL
ncbi:MAG: response regulator [Cyanophyceae cyanobacterium]